MIHTVALKLKHLLTSPPAPPADCSALYFKSDGNLYTKNAAGTERLVASPATPAGIPPGVILETGASSAPPGYLVCDGAAVSRTGYADLFDAIGTTYGAGNGSTTFNLPNTNGRFLRSSGPGVPLGDTGGSTSITVSDHTHSITAQDLSRATNTATTSSGGSARLAAASGTHAHGGATGSGGGATYNTLPPYLVVNHIIKT